MCVCVHRPPVCSRSASHNYMMRVYATQHSHNYVCVLSFMYRYILEIDDDCKEPITVPIVVQRSMNGIEMKIRPREPTVKK